VLGTPPAFILSQDQTLQYSKTIYEALIGSIISLNLLKLFCLVSYKSKKPHIWRNSFTIV
jgi:hypothetical protein